MSIKLKIGYLFFLVSFIALLTQVIYLRQVLLLFEQSEYIISVFLFFWLGANGLGIFLGNRKNYSEKKLLLLTQIYSLCAIVFYHILVLSRPELLGIKTSTNLILGISYTLFSITIISGFNGWLFAQFAKQGENHTSVIELYRIETLAFIIAGILSTIIVFYYPAFWVLAIAVVALQIAVLSEKRRWSGYIVAAMAAGMIILMPWIHSFSFEPLFPGYGHMETKSSPSGEISLLSPPDGSDTLVLFQGSPAITIKPPAAYEEAAYPALAQGHKNPDILIGGNDIIPLLEGLAQSSYKKIQILTDDIHLFDILKTHFPAHIQEMLQQKNIQVVNETIQKHLKNPQNKYDIIYINEPRPALMENALLYFPANLKILHKGLNNGGCLSLLFQSEGAFSGRINKNLKGSIFNTTSNIFTYTDVLALNTYTIILAAKSPLSTSFSEMEKTLMNNGIHPNYFNEFHVGTRLMNQESIGVDQIQNFNTSLSFNKPTVYLAGLLQMFQKYSVNITNKLMKAGEKIYTNLGAWQLFTLIVFLSVFTVFSTKNAGYAIVFHGGFVGIAAQIMFIYFYQLHFGHIYLLIGLLFAFFMVGLLGGLMVKCPNQRKWLSAAVLFLIAGLLILLTTGAFQIAVYTGILLSGLYTGLLFNTVSQHKKIPDLHLYINDLLGAMAGNILVPLIIIPLLGFYVPMVVILCMGFITHWQLHKKF